MKAQERKVIRVSSQSDEFIRRHAASKGIDIGTAADKLLEIARGRLEALAKFRASKKAA